MYKKMGLSYVRGLELLDDGFHSELIWHTDARPGVFNRRQSQADIGRDERNEGHILSIGQRLDCFILFGFGIYDSGG
jgi:hypothetical protein